MTTTKTKTKLKKVADQAVKIAGPFLIAALLGKLAGGKLDLKTAAFQAAEEALRRARLPKAPQAPAE